MNCAMCSEPIDPRAKGVFIEQTGWSVQRHQGGTNQISLPRSTGRYAHSWCIKLAKHPQIKGQQALA